MARRETDPPHDNDPLKGGLKHNPFAALRPKTEGGHEVPAKSVPTESASQAGTSRDVAQPAPKSPSPRASEDRPATTSPERVTVRRERSGRGGKTVTIAEGPGFAGRDLEALAKEVARGLGAGARVENGSIVVQGEQPDRLVAWLAARGFKSVGRGN